MKNRDLYHRDPASLELPNNGVSKVAEVGQDERLLRTLRFELETFVCNGEYARGMERILRAYLDGLNRAEQQAAWVSGFFGSGKSHLVKVLRYLWEDYRFPDGTPARALVSLPQDIQDHLRELSNRAKPLGGLRAVAGTLGTGSTDNVRLAFAQLAARAAGLPENLAQARFLLWLRHEGLEAKVSAALTEKGRELRKEVTNLYLSTALAEALVQAQPTYGTPANAQAALRSNFADNKSPTMAQTLDLLRQTLGIKGRLPCTLLVLDEVQQYIGDKSQRAHDIQEIAENCCTRLDQRLLLVGTGQSALIDSSHLQKIQARFAVRVQLSDTDVESVIRETVLRKKPEHEPAIRSLIEARKGEVSRHLQNSRLATLPEDEQSFIPDFPLLPTRRRLWEKILRVTDHSGTKSQLRSQLQIVFEATRATADLPLGSVIPADFIYDQIAPDLINTGEIEREYDEAIRRQCDGTPQGTLRSSLCALAVLIAKLPRADGTDLGVRATAETLVDLLVSDLALDRPRLEAEVPQALAQLVQSGQLMQVGEEYLLQTRESARWTHDFNRRRAAVLNDDPRLNAKRTDLLREAVIQALRPVNLQQGQSRESRRLVHSLSSLKPPAADGEVQLWLRDGWSDDLPTVLNDARSAGLGSPMLFAHIPREHHEELRQAIAAEIAAQETLDAQGPGATPEAISARKSIETQHTFARQQTHELLGRILGGSRVFLGGGGEANGIELADKVLEAAESAMARLFPHFSDADHANWGQVLHRARSGDVAALALVGHPGDATRHPVGRRVFEFIGAGKKGKDVRDQFKKAPFGWPQDAVDGVLLVMLAAGNLRASENGQPVTIQNLPQNKIGVTSFHVDVPPLSVDQRMALKALFSKLDVKTGNGQEATAAGEFLAKLAQLAASAGGEAPRPITPSLTAVHEAQALSGNALLSDLFERKDAFLQSLTAWKKQADTLAKRLPGWDRLLECQRFAAGLPEAEAAAPSIQAILAQRSLLAEPDPVPPLRQSLVLALRQAVDGLQQDVARAFTQGEATLAADGLWNRLRPEQKAALTATCTLVAPAPDPVGSEEEVLAALRKASLSERRNLLDAIPQRFQRALAEAAKLLEPKATRVALPGATIQDLPQLDAWYAEVRQTVEQHLKNGPVIL
jgi:hypothetical protein